MDNGGTTILIIEDEAVVRQSMADHLEDLQYRVLGAENGRAGLEVFEREKVDLVLVDLRMPEMGGLEVLGRIAEMAPEMPTIVVSGTGVIDDAIGALHRGAWDYVLKPIKDFAVLTRAIDNALEKAQLKRENRRYQQHLEQMVRERTRELERANRKLRESEQQFRSILDNIRTGIIIVYGHSREIAYANPTAAEMIESTPEKMIGCRCDDVLCSDEAGRCPVLDLGVEVDSSERMLTTRNGRQIPVLKTAARTIFQGKECLLESFVDLTAQKAAAAEKASLESQLRQAQKMEALGTLAGGIAHDFNNVLSAVIGYAELCSLDIDDSSHPMHQMLQSILRAGNRAKDLVSQILTFSRMQEHHFAPVSIAPIVQETLKLLKASLPADIVVENNIATRQKAMADATQIHQVIMNLCTNAYHAMEEQGGRLRVSLESVLLDEQKTVLCDGLAPGPYLQLTVEDTGVGISPSVLGSIFEPYFTTKKKDKGTGLGLAVVHGIIKSHAGAITVDSRVGKGTTFSVYLPVVEDETETESQKRTGFPSGNEKILLVDDEKDLVAIGSQMLGTLGYDVTGAVGSANALKMFRQSPNEFDLVVTDLNMPEMAGDRLAQELAGVRPDIPIIICTGFTRRLDPKQAQMTGVRKVILKPLTMDALAQSVREVLDNPRRLS